MEDRYDEVLSGYDFFVKGMGRVRGAVLLDTDKGYKLMQETRASAGRLVWDHRVSMHLRANGFVKIDAFNLNNEGNISTPGPRGTRYTVKDWYIGNECCLKEKNDIFMASQNMALLHKNLLGIKKDEAYSCAGTDDILDVFNRHQMELRRIRNYIKGNKDKNEFKIALLKVFPMYFEQGKKAVDMLTGGSYEEYSRRVEKEGQVYHGSYTYHNIIKCSDGFATTVFDKCAYGMQLLDLYYFLRKVMEKNEWNSAYGNAVIKGYESIKPLDDIERNILGIFLMYPEKFWKLSSYYMNGKKTLTTAKNMQKLEAINSQFDDRERFIREIML